MNDDLENFNRILKENPPFQPDGDKKAAAISKAMAAFDQKSALSSQGTSQLDRLIGTAWAGFWNFLREELMKRTRLAAGAAAAIVAIIAVTYSVTSPPPQSAIHSRLVSPPSLKEPPSGAASPYFLDQQKIAETAKNGTSSDSSSMVGSPASTPPSPQSAGGVATAQTDLSAAASPIFAAQQKKADMDREKSALATGGSALPTPVGQNAAIDEMASAEKPRKDPLIQLKGEIEHQNQQIAQLRQQQLQASLNAGKFQQTPVLPSYRPQIATPQLDKFEPITVNPVKVAREEPLSTVALDVDTASYSFVRAALSRNEMPQKDAVRIEEMINYFPYDYDGPKSADEPFKTNLAVFPSPWNAETKILEIGIKGYQVQAKEKPRANLVFLIDTSGSMGQPNKLPLVQNALKMLVDTLKDEDTVGIVTYAGAAGVALEPTQVKNKEQIISVINSLHAWGSTAGSEGLRVAYQLAAQNFDKEAVNRVILSTDGDFNVGITSTDDLKSFITKERDTGIFLSVLGVGMGDYNDAMMETLAKNGNGTASYVDNINEARKVLVEEASSTIIPIAKDVKIQVEFNPATVSEYRLIGYENKLLKREDFKNDQVAAGEVGSGHTVTAIYEITPINSNARVVDDLRYGSNPPPAEAVESKGDEYAFVKIRYKLPDSDTSKLITTPVNGKVEYKKIDQAPKDAQFATSVAAFGQILRGDAYTKSFTFDDVVALASSAKGADPYGYRAEFINLVRMAKNAPGSTDHQ